MSPLPTVKVVDANGTPLSNVAVTFAITGGAGALTGASTVTDQQGIARVEGWTLDTRAGSNTLSATAAQLPPVVFTAIGGPGPPASMTRHNDNQFAAVGNSVPVPPAVTVADKHGNPVPGITVVFEHGLGFGTVTGPNAVTDANGRAAVGSWTLQWLGVNTLMANIPGIIFVVFTAEGYGPCHAPRHITFGTVYNGHLGNGDCHMDDAAYGDFNQFSATGSFRVSLSAPGFDALLRVYDSDRTPLAVNDNAHPDIASSVVRIIGPSSPETYVLVASSATRDTQGDFTLASEPVPANVTNCEEVFIRRPAATAQSLEPTDCFGATFYDRYTIYLKQGESVRVSMTSAALGKNLELLDPAGARVATATGEADITFVAPEAGYYIIRAGSGAPGETGPYTLGVN